MVVDIGGVGQGVSELLQAVYKAVAVFRSSEVKFWFPQFGEGDPVGVGLRGVR